MKNKAIETLSVRPLYLPPNRFGEPPLSLSCRVDHDRIFLQKKGWSYWVHKGDQREYSPSVKNQNRWAAFATSVAASLESWNVTVASAAERLPKMEGMDDKLEELVIDV